MENKATNIDTNIDLVTAINTFGVKKTTELYKLNVVVSKKYPELYLFRYTHESPNSKVTKQARSIILNKKNGWLPVAISMDKFITSYDKNDVVKVEHKIDGTQAILYYYNGWNVGTSRNPDGDTVIDKNNEDPLLFKDLFWDIFHKYYKSDWLSPDLIYTFELVSSRYTIVIEPPLDMLYLLLIKDKKGHEINSTPHEFRKPPTIKELNTDLNIINCEKVEGLILTINNGKKMIVLN